MAAVPPNLKVINSVLRFKRFQDYISQQKLHPLYDTQNTGT